MREMTIGKNDAGQRLDRFLSKSLPLLPPALAQKYIRIKRVKVNGGRAQRDQRLREGDTLQLYINDEFFDRGQQGQGLGQPAVQPLPGVVFGYCKTFHNYNEFIIESSSTKKMRPLRALVMPPWSVEWLPLITGITFHMPVVTESAL